MWAVTSAVCGANYRSDTILYIFYVLFYLQLIFYECLMKVFSTDAYKNWFMFTVVNCVLSAVDCWYGYSDEDPLLR